MDHTNPRFKKHRLNPYRILVLVLFHDYDFVRWDCDKCTVRTAKLARLLRTSSGRVREYAKWLQEHGYVSNLDMDHGWFSFTAVTPKHLVDEFDSKNPDNTVEFILDEGPVRDADAESEAQSTSAAFDPSDPFSVH